MKVVAVIPIKLNSERLPNKNIKPFSNGVPLCHYIFNTMLKVKGVDEVYVYCSSERIIPYLPAGVKYLKRDECLDRNTTKINEVLSAFAQDVPADIYVMSHTTAPFLKHTRIEEGLQAVRSGQYDSSFAVRRIQTFMWRDGQPMNYSLDDIPRTQDLTPVFYETSGFYIYRQEIINGFNRRVGEHSYMVEVDELEAVDIDNAGDFDFADKLIRADINLF